MANPDREYTNNLVITGDSLYHRRIHDLLKELNYYDINKQESKFVAALDNLSIELFPRIKDEEFQLKKNNFYLAIDAYRRNDVSGSKQNPKYMIAKRKAYNYLKSFGRELIIKAHEIGLFLRETKEKNRAVSLKQYFKDIDI